MAIPSSPADRALDRIAWQRSIPFFLLHGAVLLALVVQFHWWSVPLAAGSYLLRMFFVTAGYHRYFSHRSFRTSRAFQFVLAFMAQTSGQKGVLWWSSHHRIHHLSSDTDADVHSPVRRGFWWAHVGWILSRRWDRTQVERVKDLAAYPELRLLDRWPLTPAVLYGAAMWAAFGASGFVWGFLVSTVLLYHGTFFINSLTHLFGRRRFATSDDSRNSLILALITLGEGWHNNHHHYQSSANQGFYWFEIDLTYWALKVLSWMGIVKDLRRPPPKVLAEGRLAKVARTASGLVPQVSRPALETR